MANALKLVEFESPIRATIQGDGVWLGLPMVFLRLHGCDYSCSWCDTKDSWRPGSPFRVMDTMSVAMSIVLESRGLRALSITGGNPMLQAKEVAALLKLLGPVPWKVLIETQASFFNDDVQELLTQQDHHQFMLSLSPKLHDWRMDPIKRMIRTTLLSRWGSLAQIKVVVNSQEACRQALDHFTDLGLWARGEGIMSKIDFILLPEYSLGRKNVETTIAAVGEFFQARSEHDRGFSVRVIPQLHKISLFVP